MLLVPKVNSDGSFKESQWFDVDRVEVTGKSPYLRALEREALKRTRAGSDKPAPKR